MNIPQKTTGYRSKVINKIIDALNAMKLVDSPDHRKIETSNGVILHNVAEKTTRQLMPFELYLDPSGDIRMRNGLWYSQGRLRTADVDTTGDEFVTVSTGTLTASEDYWVYIILDTDGTTKYVARVSLKTDTTKPPYSLPEYPTQATDAQILSYTFPDWQLIGEFSTDADKKIINVKNWTVGQVLKTTDAVPDSVTGDGSTNAYAYDTSASGSIDYANTALLNNHGNRLELKNFSKNTTVSVSAVEDFVIREGAVGAFDVGYFSWDDFITYLDGRYKPL